MLIIGGGQDDGAEAVGQLQGHLLAGNHPQSVGKIAHIEADFQFLAVTGKNLVGGGEK